MAALDIVRQGADVMPRSQLDRVLDSELGSDWSTNLSSFDYEPIAAASIGQVMQLNYVLFTLPFDCWPFIHFALSFLGFLN